MASSTLKHHGIFGMRWGIRRFQNEDGTLTEAGKKRYRNNDKFAEQYDKGARRQRYAEANNEKALRKIYSEGNEKGIFKKRDRTIAKISDELNESDEYKNYVEFNQMLAEAAVKAGGRLVVGQEIYDHYNKLQKAYQDKGRQLVDDHMDELMSNVLSDLNYEDTKEGRDYLKKLGVADWPAKISQNYDQDDAEYYKHKPENQEKISRYTATEGKEKKHYIQAEPDPEDIENIQRKAIEKVNKKYENVDLTKDKKAADAYDRDFIDTYNSMLDEYERNK